MKAFLNWLVGLFGFYVSHKDEWKMGKSETMFLEPLKLETNKTLLVFKLGNLNHKVFATPETIAKLENKLTELKEQIKNGDKLVTLVWDDALEVTAYGL